jgi:hypothetical protein
LLNYVILVFLELSVRDPDFFYSKMDHGALSQQNEKMKKFNNDNDDDNNNNGGAGAGTSAGSNPSNYNKPPSYNKVDPNSGTLKTTTNTDDFIFPSVPDNLPSKFDNNSPRNSNNNDMDDSFDDLTARFNKLKK